jgi:hypothetical protein
VDRLTGRTGQEESQSRSTCYELTMMEAQASRFDRWEGVDR